MSTPTDPFADAEETIILFDTGDFDTNGDGEVVVGEELPDPTVEEATITIGETVITGSTAIGSSDALADLGFSINASIAESTSFFDEALAELGRDIDPPSFEFSGFAGFDSLFF